MKKKVLITTLLIGVVTTSILMIPARKETYNRILLSDNISGINFTQEINNNYYKNSVQPNTKISIGQALVDLYVTMKLKGEKPNNINSINEMYSGYSTTKYMNASEKQAYLYLLDMGIIKPEIPNNMNELLPNNLASEWYSRLMDKSVRLDNFTNSDITNGYSLTKLKVVKTDSPPVINTTSVKVGNTELLGTNNEWELPLNGYKNQWNPGMQYNKIIQTSIWTDMGSSIMSEYHKLKSYINTSVNGDSQDGTNYKNNTSTVKGSLDSQGASDGINQSINGSTEAYTITRVFDTNKGDGNQITQYYLWGHPLNKNFLKDNPECKEVKSVTTDKNGDFTVVFDVTGVSTQQVIANLNAITSYVDTNGALQSTYIPAYTKVTQGGNSVDYVSASTFRTFNNEIQAIKGKLLRNQITGAEAVLLDNSHECIIGNEVYHFDSPTTITIGNELYYNLDLVDKLLSNSYLGNLTGEDTIYYSPSLTNQEIYSVNNSSGKKIQNALVQELSGIQEYQNQEATSTMYKDKLPIVNLTQLTKAVDTTIYPYASASEGNVTMVINWSVELPSDIKNKIASEAKGSTSNGLTIAQLNSTYYAMPTDPNLKQFWNENLQMDNALANRIYGTSNEQYFTCGYLVPKITLLTSKKLTQQEMYDVLESMGIQNPNNYYNPQVTEISTGTSSLNSARTLNDAPAGNKIGQLTQYGADYFEGTNGIIYQALQVPNKTDSKVNITIPNPNIDKIDTSSKTITLMSSSGKNIKPVKSDLKVGQNVYLFGTQYIYQGKQVDSANGETYYALLYPNALNGVISVKDNKASFDIGATVGGASVKSISFTEWNEQNLLQGHLDSINNQSIVIPTGAPNELPYNSGINGYIYVNGNVLNSPNPSSVKYSDYSLGHTLNKEEQDNQNKMMSSLNNKQENGKAYDVLLLSTSQFDAYKQPNEQNANTIFATKDMLNKLDTATILPNFFNRGLNQGVIDSIIGNCYDYRSQSQLPQGARVLIGNTYFTQYDGNLISDPMTSLANLVDGKNILKFRGDIASQFSGISISNGVGKTSSLDTYLTKASLGMEIPTMDYKGYSGNILMSNNGEVEVFDPHTPAINLQSLMNNNPYGIGIQPYNTQPISSAIVQVQFSPEIKFMEVSPGMYTLVYYTNEEGPGIMNNTTLFNNNLNGPDFYMFTQFSKSTFNRLGNANSLIQEYKNKMTQSFENGLAGFIERIIIIYLSWAWVGVFIVYYIKMSKIFDDVLIERIKDKREEGKKPIDWLWIASAFILNAEEEVNFVKFVVCQLLITILLFLVWNYVIFGKIFLPV